MLAVGRALMSNPDVLLLDEATGGLSPLLARKLWEHVAQLAREGVGIVAVEQNVRLALEYSDYVYVLAGGRNHLDGTPAELSSRPDFAQLFLEAPEDEEAKTSGV
jgi:branched-chain amino acid transport system ATP-binding protein